MGILASARRSAGEGGLRGGEVGGRDVHMCTSVHLSLSLSLPWVESVRIKELSLASEEHQMERAKCFATSGWLTCSALGWQVWAGF